MSNKNVIEDLYTQKITIAEVVLYKNYSIIEETPLDKIDLNVKNQNDLDDIFSKFIPMEETKKMDDFTAINLIPINLKGSYKQFYNRLLKTDAVTILNKCTLGNSYCYHILDSNDKFFKYYKEPFSDMRILNLYRRIRKNGDKYTFIYYAVERTRHVNQKYFVKNTKQKSFTIDTKTGNFYFSNTTKKNKKIRCNSFYELNNFLSEFIVNDNEKLLIKNYFFKGIIRNEKVINEINNKFNDNDYVNKIKEITGFELNFNNKENISKFIINFFVSKNKIKVPNNCDFYFSNYYPTKKALKLKKNENNLIKTILNKYQLNTKYFNKLLNKFDNINLDALQNFCFNLLGENYGKYFSLLTDDAIEVFFTKPTYTIKKWDYSTKNKINIILMMNEFVKNELPKNNNERLNFDFLLLNDHYEMLNNIKEIGIKREFNAHNLKTFHEEHNEFTILLKKIREGYDIKKVYSEDLINAIEKPFTIKYNEELILIKPLVLKTKEEYYEEGNYLGHCVSSYVERDCVIVSIRIEGMKERVTIEYSYNGHSKQERTFRNQLPPDFLYPAISTVHNRILKFAPKDMYEQNLLEPIEVIKTPLFIEGIEIKRPVSRMEQH